MTRKLIAEKSHKYGTRRMVAGDEYEATDMHAKVLVGIRKARYAPEKLVAPVMQKAETEAQPQASSADLDRLRHEAHQLGIQVDGRWGDIRLRHEISMARASQPR